MHNLGNSWEAITERFRIKKTDLKMREECCSIALVD